MEMDKINVQALYTTFNGEQNPFGIGSPTIFLRLGGCHLRCYKKTLGVLCDTPEALESGSGEDMTFEELFTKLEVIKQTTGINKVCLTGGDPLWRHPDKLHRLFGWLNTYFLTTVETSGTISAEPFMLYDKVFWILDYKLKSAGVKNPCVVPSIYHYLRETDFIKFVVYDEDDYKEMLDILKQPWVEQTIGTICVGAYWGGKIDTFQLFRKLEEDKLLNFVEINMQTHKMAQACNVEAYIDPLT